MGDFNSVLRDFEWFGGYIQASHRGDKALLTRWQVHQIVTSSKVLGNPNVESTRTFLYLD